jgi:hypothetical protein
LRPAPSQALPLAAPLPATTRVTVVRGPRPDAGRTLADRAPQILGGHLPPGSFPVIELDQRPDGPQLQDELERMTVGGAAGCPA